MTETGCAKFVYEKSHAPDPLPLTVQEDLVDPLFFYDLFLSDTQHDTTTGVQYLQLSSFENVFETDRIIIRDCYTHMEPHILRQLDSSSNGGRGRIAITGTPGIGKSVFGSLLARNFVRKESSSVVYWVNDYVYLFSWDVGVKNHYGLSQFARDGDKTLFAGSWQNKTEMIGFASLLADERMVVIHDPKADDFTVALSAYLIRKILFIVSYGHALMGHWASKNLGPHLYLYLPVWTLLESTNAAQLLSFIEHNKANKLFQKFGGCIRGWRASLEEKWRSLSKKRPRTL